MRLAIDSEGLLYKVVGTKLIGGMEYFKVRSFIPKQGVFSGDIGCLQAKGVTVLDKDMLDVNLRIYYSTTHQQETVLVYEDYLYGGYIVAKGYGSIFRFIDNQTTPEKITY